MRTPESTTNEMTPKTHNKTYHIKVKKLIILLLKAGILKAEGEKHLVLYKETPEKLSADFSTQTLQTGRAWHVIFNVLREKKSSNQEYST